MKEVLSTDSRNLKVIRADWKKKVHMEVYQSSCLIHGKVHKKEA